MKKTLVLCRKKVHFVAALLLVLGVALANAQDAETIPTANQVDGRLQDLGARQIRRDDSRPGRPVVFLDLSGTKIQRTAFSMLVPYLQEVVELNLAASNVGDDDLKELVKLPKIKILSLNGTKVTDKGIERLEQLKNLVELDLSLTATDGSSLKKCKSLRKLSLGGTKATDGSVKGVTGLNLCELDLSYTDLSDQGVKELERMRSLDRLVLEGTKLTDKGLARLATFSNLKEITVGFTEVTKEVADALQKKNTKIKIIWLPEDK